MLSLFLFFLLFFFFSNNLHLGLVDGWWKWWRVDGGKSGGSGGDTWAPKCSQQSLIRWIEPKIFFFTFCGFAFVMCCWCWCCCCCYWIEWWLTNEKGMDGKEGHVACDSVSFVHVARRALQ
ncbi:hypothetical protein BKA80DRAFT_97215 [Phyllosticta citrichinensis]